MCYLGYFVIFYVARRNILATHKRSREPITATIKDDILKPVTPTPKSIPPKYPPTTAPKIPNTIEPKIPPDEGLGSIKFAIDPAINPNIM